MIVIVIVTMSMKCFLSVFSFSLLSFSNFLDLHFSRLKSVVAEKVEGAQEGQSNIAWRTKCDLIMY